LDILIFPIPLLGKSLNGYKAEEIKEQIREEVKLLLYNNRSVIKNK